MSYAIMPYAVRMDDLRSMIGSRDRRLLDGLLTHYADELADIDGLRDNVGLGGDEVTSAQTALRQMIMGEEYDQRIGFVYGYCFKLLCRVLKGTSTLGNDGWWSMRFGWFGMVHEELKNAGVDFDPTSLIFSGTPFGLPSTDFPCIGHTTPDEMRGLLESLGPLGPDSVGDPDAWTAIRQIREWLEICLETERDLVCFYH
ncbi:DUF7691 family protein [Thermomonospora cellulosilytica]|uniref:DUF7691 domain-containing protein n=1 Tax=Thermomonospora cellulosilytica TaxID=1411118 RepID=A0A7W3N023_9ACTN|nr:hypothetical protein [Thermomonospora cellulosilytica]MBA9005050.1 hypothetical protein [Thermomonospora cellulosilytica]